MAKRKKSVMEEKPISFEVWQKIGTYRVKTISSELKTMREVRKRFPSAVQRNREDARVANMRYMVVGVATGPPVNPALSKRAKASALRRAARLNLARKEHSWLDKIGRT